jgi:hypothetical protein
MPVPLLEDTTYLRELAAQFRETANTARRFDKGTLVNALALELLVKADLIEQLTNIMSGV